MRTTLITTLNHNIGDDFVRRGIIFILRQWLRTNASMSFLDTECINKHIPIMTRDRIDQMFNLSNMPTNNRMFRGFMQLIMPYIDMMPIDKKNDKMFYKDLIVQCGTPFYWSNPDSHCHENEWYKMLIRKRYWRSNLPSIFNLAVGSCQPYESDGSEFLRCKRCQKYIEETFRIASVTTVRDKLAKKILNNQGLDAPLIACPSIFIQESLCMQNLRKKYLCVNFMKDAGHYNFHGTNNWEKVFKEFYERMKHKFPIIFVCHNKQEIKDAKGIDPDAVTFYSDNFEDYAKVYSQALCGVVNRVHASFAMASFGTQSVLIGADSRASMVEEIGITPLYVKNVGVGDIIGKLYECLGHKDRYEKNIKTLKNTIKKEYVEVLNEYSPC